jgi:hypothetical protein
MRSEAVSPSSSECRNRKLTHYRPMLYASQHLQVSRAERGRHVGYYGVLSRNSLKTETRAHG